VPVRHSRFFISLVGLSSRLLPNAHYSLTIIPVDDLFYVMAGVYRHVTGNARWHPISNITFSLTVQGGSSQILVEFFKVGLETAGAD
jgi:hypothetical protein